MLRGLIHFWRMSAAVAASAAVATAVLTGALVVGDSVRESLRHLALDRLGQVDLALLSEHFVGQDLATRLSTPERPVVPLIALRGSAVHPDTGARASGVSVYGVAEDFGNLFPPGSLPSLDRPPGEIFPSLVVNEALRRELGARPGETVVLSFPRQSEVPRDTLLGDSDPQEVLDTLRLRLAAVVPDEGLGRFALDRGQGLPKNAFLALPRLQRALDRPGRINALLVPQLADAAPEGDGGSAEELQAQLGGLLELSDLGLTVTPGPLFVTVASRELLLRPAAEAAVLALAHERGAKAAPYLTYLANRLEVGGRVLPYSTVTGLDLPVAPDFGTWATPDGGEPPSLAPGEILLNSWAARDLGIDPGGEADLDLTYYAVGPGDRLETRVERFRVAGEVTTHGLGADPSLTPDFPGISDANNLADWHPPFPVDLSLVRPRDDDYWDEHRGSPKAFVRLEDARRLWSSRFGALSGIRVAVPAGAEASGFAEELTAELLARLAPQSFGLRFQPVRRQSLEGAAGSTDFNGLFVGFSLFLIVAAALLVGLLFRLGVERRAGELGLELAVGFPKAKVRRRQIAEGVVLAVVGAGAGSLLAAVYAGWLMRRLAAWWAPLVPGSVLALHLRPGTLALGGLLAVLLVVATVAFAVRQIARRPPRDLLAGVLGSGEPVGSGRLARGIAWTTGGLGALLLALGALTGQAANPAFFFASAASLLVAGLAGFAVWCRTGGGSATVAGLATMAARSSARNPGRSLLSVTLVATASFLLVAVAANRREVSPSSESTSGAGGFNLMAESAVALRQSLSSAEDLALLGFSDDEAQALGDTEIFPLRRLPGEDTSCLNLFRPERPRVLGVPPALVERGGFSFQSLLDATDEERANPWLLLGRSLEAGVVPAFGDANSVRWILHSGLGQDLTLEDEAGRPLRLRFVGLLSTSLFQSEVLIAEAPFLEHFPSHGGYGTFLLAAPPTEEASVSQLLEARLAAFGFDVSSTRERLEAYHQVENLYLSTFQVLGGLGLLLGTVGLGIVLLRNVLERRAELAALRAFGFRRLSLAGMVVVENAFLLAVGLAVGAVSGLLAIAPYLWSGTTHVPWGTLLSTLGVVFVAGLTSSLVAALGASRVPLLPVLKGE